MNILFISKSAIGIDLVRKLQNEGHNVKLYIEDKRVKECFSFMVKKITNWKKELVWVKDGLIIFDDCGYGKIQDDLRKKGFNVFGGNAVADKIEYNREYTTSIFEKYKINTFKTKTFKNILDAAEFAIKHRGQWVIKREGNNTKFVSHVGEDHDGRDVIMLLKNYSVMKNLNKQSVSLQKRIQGIEIGVGRYFNGNNWVGPIEMNVEHPHLFSGAVGPFTSEMGTVAWYTEKENKLYKETLAKLETFLREINYKGDIGINCIVNKNKVYALELTPRIGTPIIHLQSEIHTSPWGEFLLAIAKGENYKLKYKKGYGVVMTLAVPPFPFGNLFQTNVCYGLSINIKKTTKEERKHIHFEEVSRRPDKEEFYYVSGHDGYVCYTTAVGKTISIAHKKSLSIAQKIHVPKIFFRNDIGLDFEKESLPKLKKWGWV
jgi:phosphoribosylamine---glycine ligase